jgi:hypothetical protein
MTDELKKNSYGRTTREVIGLLPGELLRDAVGLWQIIPHARDGFGLEGADLIDFIDRSIRSLLGAGALPVRHVPGSKYEWDVQHQYGSSPDDIVAAIIREWQAMPDDPLVLCGEGVWFARPRPGTRHVKVD